MHVKYFDAEKPSGSVLNIWVSGYYFWNEEVKQWCGPFKTEKKARARIRKKLEQRRELEKLKSGGL